jgi:hypothetical protein
MVGFEVRQNYPDERRSDGIVEEILPRFGENLYEMRIPNFELSRHV